MPIYEVELPSNYVRHITLLRSILEGIKDQPVVSSTDYLCGVHDTVTSIAKLLDPRGFLIPTEGKTSVEINPILFNPLQTYHLNELQRKYYEASLATVQYQINTVYRKSLIT